MLTVYTLNHRGIPLVSRRRVAGFIGGMSLVPTTWEGGATRNRCSREHFREGPFYGLATSLPYPGQCVRMNRSDCSKASINLLLTNDST